MHLVQPSCDDTICGVDQYVSANTCTAALRATNTDGGDNAAGEDTACDDTICGVDQYVSANTYSPFAGTTNTDGDNASGTNTVCQSSDFPARSATATIAISPAPMVWALTVFMTVIWTAFSTTRISHLSRPFRTMASRHRA